MQNLYLKLIILPMVILAGFFIFPDGAQAEEIDSSDLAIWHFDENSDDVAYDATSNHNNFGWGHNHWSGGRIIPERVAGRWDLGVYFNQYEEHFYSYPSTPIEFPNGLTVGAWIKTDLSSNYKARFFWLGNTLDRVGIPSNHFMLSVKNGYVYLDLKQEDIWTQELVSNIKVNDNNWHFINARFNSGNNVIALFIDGQKQEESSFNLPIPNLERIDIGRRENYWASNDTNFKGAVDDAWIRSESLTDERIQQIYSSGNPYQAEAVLPVDEPVTVKAYYNFDDLSENTAYDLSGNDYNLGWGYNPYGGGESEPRSVAGKWEGAVNFKKVEDLFSRGFSPNLTFPDGAVIGAWIKTTASSNPAARILWIGNIEDYGTGVPECDSDNGFYIAEYQGKALFNLYFIDGCDATSSGPKCHYRSYHLSSNSLINDGGWHFLTVVLDPRPFNHSMKLYIDGTLEAEEFFPDPLPFIEGMRVGFREYNSCDSRCNFDGDIDDLFILDSIISAEKIQQIYESNQPFDLLTAELDPVIIVPGIMGSFEKNDEWHIDPILHTYDNLIEAMVNSGYKIGDTLFTLPYDWRASNVTTADLLKQKIDEVKNKTGKVDIVAHSMGGLAARYYIQSNEEHYVDQLIFLGTPHQGSPRSYLTYEGGYIPGRLGGIMKYIFQVEAIKHGYFSLAKYIREQITSVEQLLPVYNYLQERVNDSWQHRLYPVQYPRNTFLENLNIEPAIDFLKQRVNIANIYSSAGVDSTLRAIKVVPDPDIYDSKWMDGYPENLDNNLDCLIGGDGDGTVPIESLNFLSGVDIIEIADANHRGIVTKAQQDIIEILAGERPKNEDYCSGPWAVIKRVLFIRVYSPVDFTVIAPDGKRAGKDFEAGEEVDEDNRIPGSFYSGFDSEVEFVAILNPAEGDYQVKLQGTDNGAYQLGIGILEDDGLGEPEENLVSGIISAGEEESFVISHEEDTAEIKIVKEASFKSLMQDLNELYRDGEIKKGSVKRILDIKFRHLSKKYDKIEEREKELHKQILKKQIIHFLKIIKKELKFYLKKAWITQTSYDILINDITNVINKLN